MPVRATSCVVFVCAAAVVIAAQAPDRAQTEAQARRVNERIRALESEADRLAGQARTLLGELRAFELQRQLQLERAKEATAAVERGTAALADATGKLDSLEAQRVAQLPDLQIQLVDIYKRGRAGYARLLFGAESMREFSRSVRAVAALMRIDEQRVAGHRRTLEDLQRQRLSFQEELKGLETRQAEVRAAQAAAERAIAARAALITQIDVQRDLNAQFAGELQLAYDRLQAQVKTAGPEAAPEAVEVPLEPFRGALEWPAPGRVAVRFGQPSGRMGDTTLRNGIEIAAPEGATVRAIHPGTVTYAGTFTGFGELVIVDHGQNTSTLYGYLANVSVVRGTRVVAGDELGHAGLTPLGPPGLYFEVRVDGRSVDPVEWLRPR